MRFNEEKNNNKFYDDKIAQLKKEREEEFDSAFSYLAEYTELVNKIDLVLANQEAIIDLLSKKNKETPISTKREVFKKNVITNKMIKVGTIDENDRISLDAPLDTTIYSPSIYENSWAVKHLNLVDSFIPIEPKGLITIMGEKVVQNEIILNRRGITFTTGVITVDGKAIYYDQYSQ